MNLNDVIFVDSLPKLDLHGFDRETARVAINDFIKDNKVQKIEVFAIVHGQGSGILKKTTAETLHQNKNVLEFKTYYYNSGCTIVKINI